MSQSPAPGSLEPSNLEDSGTEPVDKSSHSNGSSTAPKPSGQRQSQIKGSCAKFHFQNPRFINAPVPHLSSREKCNSVQDCFEWSSVEERCYKESSHMINGAKVPSLSQSHKTDKEIVPMAAPQRTSQHCSRSFQHPLCIGYRRTRKPGGGVTNPILPNPAVKCREKISFHHDYNSRLDPNEPPRGKLHGSFVWRDARSSDPSRGDKTESLKP